jgi:hypothetical protein
LMTRQAISCACSSNYKRLKAYMLTTTMCRDCGQATQSRVSRQSNPGRTPTSARPYLTFLDDLRDSSIELVTNNALVVNNTLRTSNKQFCHCCTCRQLIRLKLLAKLAAHRYCRNRTIWHRALQPTANI